MELTKTVPQKGYEPILSHLSDQEGEALCAQLRHELIEDVSKTGGHLASNLGAVELTVALHRVFDTSVDRLVFDVGHQCYPHKMITGRRESMPTLRQYGGIAGFPKPNESVHDAFIGGPGHGPGPDHAEGGLQGDRPHRRRRPHRRAGL